MPFEYKRVEVPPGWYPGGAAVENPGRPLFTERYSELTKRLCYLFATDPELREMVKGGTCCPEGEGIGIPNYRRAALGQPLCYQTRSEEELVAHLLGCRYCQRFVELFRQAIREEEA